MSVRRPFRLALAALGWPAAADQAKAPFLTAASSAGTVDHVQEQVMPNPDSPYVLMLVLLAGALVFALAPLGLAWLWAKRFSPRKPGPDKNAIYECGLESKGDAWVQFRSEYYLYAIIFLIFDVETIFLLPFAVSFPWLSGGAFIAMIVFLLMLAEGLVWAWQKGVLTWK
jgi:NADH-quinone oxidoreductase subunit A